MCGIVGFASRENVQDLLLLGLENLEYRGYDSAGVGVFSTSGKIEVSKSSGKLKNLRAKLAQKPLEGRVGMGHTRWATHGSATTENAHPHLSSDGSVALVHNGIIENYAELKEKLLGHGYSFSSSTDSEVLANLVDYYLKKYGAPMDALARVSLRATGSFACVVMFECEKDVLYAIKKDSPLVAGMQKTGNFFASDPGAFESQNGQYVVLENHDIARLDSTKMQVFSIDQVEKPLKFVKFDNFLKKGDAPLAYPHHMLKEIFDQPKVASEILSFYTKKGDVDFSHVAAESFFKNITSVKIVGCGSAYNAGLVAKSFFEEVAGICCSTEIASEYRYNTHIKKCGQLVIAISQSGETADTLEAAQLAKRMGQKTIALVNVPHSSLARVCDVVFPTLAGKESAVATTKAYMGQVLVLQLFALFLAKMRRKIKKSDAKTCIFELSQLPQVLSNELSQIPSIVQKWASQSVGQKSVYFLGRGVCYAVLCEASLKLKELSYIHSESFPSGELKHGSIALVEEGTMVVGLVDDSERSKKTISNLIETVARGAKVNLVSEECITGFSKNIILCKSGKFLFPHIAILPFQLFAYHTALSLGRDVDRPRNLAKSVTVE